MAHPRKCDAACPDDCLIARALSGLCVGLILTNSGGKVIWVNRTAQAILGLPGNDYLGQPVDRLLKDSQLVAFWQQAAEAEGNLFGDLAVQWPRKLALKVNATRCVDDDGHEIGRALLFYDVTAERSVQVELSHAVAERLLALTSGSMPPEPVANLTHKEVRILRLVGRGKGNSEIANEVNVSTSTVRSHLKSVYRKLGMGSRAEAVSYAIRNDLV